MKSFAIVLLCVIAAVQGRSAGVNVASQRAVAVAGDSPWVVHLRVAIATSGLLETCAGSLIGPSWVLTSARCVDDARFIWMRFNAANVFTPELVFESSTVRAHHLWDSSSPVAHNIGLVSISREIEYTPTIAAVPLLTEDTHLPHTANFCAYGENEDNSPGVQLSCWDVTIIGGGEFGLLADTDNAVSKFDSGAALVSDGVQVGLFVEDAGEGTAAFVRTGAYVKWIESETGLDLGAGADKPDAVIVVDN